MAAAATTVSLRISLNAQQYTELGANHTFTFYTPPRPLQLVPAGGPRQGATVVLLTGTAPHVPTNPHPKPNPHPNPNQPQVTP